MSGLRERLVGYQPLPSQKLFHESKARFKGFSGPVGSGKSMALCVEALSLAYQNRGVMGLIGASTYNMLQDATQPALFRMLEEYRIPFDFKK